MEKRQAQLPAGDGWDWFEQARQQVEDYREQKGETAEELKLAFEACFSTPSGQVVLSYMRDWILRAEGFEPSLGFYNGAAQGFYREGMRRFLGYQILMATPANRKEEES